MIIIYRKVIILLLKSFIDLGKKNLDTFVKSIKFCTHNIKAFPRNLITDIANCLNQ